MFIFRLSMRLFPDENILMFQTYQMPYILAFSLFMIVAGLSLPRTSSTPSNFLSLEISTHQCCPKQQLIPSYISTYSGLRSSSCHSSTYWGMVSSTSPGRGSILLPTFYSTTALDLKLGAKAGVSRSPSILTGGWSRAVSRLGALIRI